MAFFTGNRGIVTSGGTNLKVTRWDIVPESELAEVTNTSSNGFREFLESLKELKGVVEFFFDSAANPHASPPNIVNGQTVALKLFLRDSTSQYYDAPTAIIRNVRILSQVGPAVTVRFEFQSTGSFTLPTANF